MPGTSPGPWFAVRLDPRRLAWRQPTLLLPQCAFPLGIGAVSLQQEVFMFEGQPQEQIEALMNANAEFPQGGWPAGHTGDAEALARAELAEETGITAGRLTHLGRLHEAHGFCTQAFDVFLAEDLEQGTPAREATESDMEHAFVSDAQFDAMLRAGELWDAPTLAALTLYRLHATG